MSASETYPRVVTRTAEIFNDDEFDYYFAPCYPEQPHPYPRRYFAKTLGVAAVEAMKELGYIPKSGNLEEGVQRALYGMKDHVADAAKALAENWEETTQRREQFVYILNNSGGKDVGYNPN